MTYLVKLIFNVIIWLLSKLPDDPFKSVVDGVVYDIDFLPQLNWFVPFDICSSIMLAWLDCVFFYILFIMVKAVVWDLIIKNLLLKKFTAGAGALLGKLK